MAEILVLATELEFMHGMNLVPASLVSVTPFQAPSTSHHYNLHGHTLAEFVSIPSGFYTYQIMLPSNGNRH